MIIFSPELSLVTGSLLEVPCLFSDGQFTEVLYSFSDGQFDKVPYSF